MTPVPGAVHLPEVHILIATRNRHKVEEITAILGAGHRFYTLGDFPGAPAVIEDADTFEGNSTKKAVTLANWICARDAAVDHVLADDSGLEVDALQGAPGVHSARFAGLDTGAQENSPDEANNAKLLRLLQNVPFEKRTARFRCVIAFTAVPERGPQATSPVCEANEAELSTLLFSGSCEGHIQSAPGGEGGFGYDPLFVPNGFSETFAQLGDRVKNSISHRSQALGKLNRFLLNAP